MDGASSNAADLVESLSLEYNKTRQAASNFSFSFICLKVSKMFFFFPLVTTELSEIVGGMAAILEN